MPRAAEVERLSVEEIDLIRLFRALDTNVRGDIMARILGVALGIGGIAIKPLTSGEREKLEDGLWRDWPADWPERSVVDLGNIGDPGAWLREGLGESWLSVLFTTLVDDDHWADELAESYAANLIENGFSMPSEFGDDGEAGVATEDDLVLFRDEFAAFLRAWRERILCKAEDRGQNSHRSDATG